VPEAPAASDVCRGEVIVYNNAPAIFPVGTNKLTWTALDAAGLTSTCEVEVKVEDREPAVLDCATERVVEAPADTCAWSGVVQAAARDNCAVEVTTLSQDRRFPVGVNDVLFTSTDPNGNVSTCTTKLDVRDVTAPTVACPADANDVIGTFKGTAQDACEVEVRIDGVVCEALDAQGQVTGTVEPGACPVAVVDGELVVSGRLLDPALRVTFQVLGEDVSGNTGTTDCALVFSADADQDGVLGENDNCPTVANTDQLDSDGDGIGNACDVCPTVVNVDQADADDDGVGDVCEDADADGVFDLVDNCLTVANAEQTDGDGDGVGDRCDVCPAVADDQADGDSNGVGDACQDADADGVIDIEDNCPALANADQVDSDGDGKGDLCDEAPFEDFAASGAGACSGGDANGAWAIFAALGVLGLLAARRRVS
jgi:MYXO-CTERM domain-containing protein